MTTADRYTDAVDIEALAATVHQAYLDTCHRLGWPVKPENQVPYSELSEDSKELDRASVRAVLHALTAAGWQPPVRHGDPRMLAAVYGYEQAHDEMPDHDQRARRDADADALAHAADLIGRHHGNQHGLRISEHVDQWAAEVRAGTRTIPPAERSST